MQWEKGGALMVARLGRVELGWHKLLGVMLLEVKVLKRSHKSYTSYTSCTPALSGWYPAQVVICKKRHKQILLLGV